MVNMYRTLLALGLMLASFAITRADDDVKSFQVRGANPDGQSGYTGTVDLRKHDDTIDVRWVTGKDGVETIGFGIRGEETIGIGYGGPALYSIAVYEIEGKKIHAVWAMTSKPGTIGKYDLKGAAVFDGVHKFADGTPGTVTMTPTAGGAYKMAWDLPSGHFEGLGVKLANSLVAVAGQPGANIGVAGYQPSADGFAGVWTSTGLGGAGKEAWTAPGDAAKAPATAATALSGIESKPLPFAGDDYFLQTSTSAPGKPTSELREFLQKGEDWNGYRKMLGFRLMSNSVKGDATSLAKGILAQTMKDFPQSATKEILMEPDHAVILFVVISGQEAEFNLWDVRRTKNGFPSAQFVLRNKAPYETPDKFKAERDQHLDAWLKELATLSEHSEEILSATAKGASATASAGSAPSAPAPAPATGKTSKQDISPELVDAIQADLQKCGAIAMQFIGHIKSGDVKSAAALMSDKAFTKFTRDEFTSGLAKAGKVFGPMESFTPDKAATDFGVVDGVMTFTLKGDAKYANAALKETLRFIREKGEIQFVSYTRTPKQ